MEYVKAQGELVPALGLGTFRQQGPDCRAAVAVGLEIGYRHLDTAQIYGNEQEVGAELAASRVDRNDVFLTTKLWNDHRTEDSIRQAVDESLRKLQTDHLDLLLVHWPTGWEQMPETLTTLARLADEGKTRLVGVSNFTPRQVDESLRYAPIFCNQVEYHPYLSQQALLDQARDLDLLLTAYSPIALGKVADDPVIADIAAAHGKTPVQVTLRWLLAQERVSAIPKATTRDHLEQNFDVFDFSLSEEERKAIAALDRGDRGTDPPWVDDWER